MTMRPLPAANLIYWGLSVCYYPDAAHLDQSSPLPELVLRGCRLEVCLVSLSLNTCVKQRHVISNVVLFFCVPQTSGEVRDVALITAMQEIQLTAADRVQRRAAVSLEGKLKVTVSVLETNYSHDSLLKCRTPKKKETHLRWISQRVNFPLTNTLWCRISITALLRTLQYIFTTHYIVSLTFFNVKIYRV